MAEYDKSPRKSLRKKVLTKKTVGIDRDLNNSDEEKQDENKNPTSLVLHNSNNEIQGKQIFNFQQSKSRRSLFNKVSELCLDNKSLSTTSDKLINKIKSKTTKYYDNESSENDYVPSDNSSESTESDNLSDNSSDNDNENNSKEKNIKLKNLNNKFPSKNLTNKRNKDYLINTDEYFYQHNSKKILTSNNTLDNLQTPRLPQDQLNKLLKQINISNSHKIKFKEINETVCHQFNKWYYFLRVNFNILIYGLGSKREILNKFTKTFLNDSPVIVVNGFFPSLSIKDILDGIINNLLGINKNFSNIHEACELIEEEFNNELNNQHLYLIIHNIEMIQVGQSQNILAKLSSINKIHLIASIDHVNAPLVWDHSKLSKFNFTWWNVTNFNSYIEETSFEGSLLVKQSNMLALSSLRNVFLSLTSNSKKIYNAIVKYQLNNNNNQYFQGLPFRDLYSQCRENFLVSSDLALRTQLTEFIDHKMVKYKRTPDGSENLIIPISNDILEKFYNEQHNL